MKTLEMLTRLQYSQNPITASVCSRILEGKETIKEAKQRNYGHFLTCVLNGQYEEALSYADLDNTRCIAEEYLIEEEQFNEW